MNTETNGNGSTKMVEKLRKLLALSASSNEHEAALAAERFHTLLAEHNLSMSDIQTTQTAEDEAIIRDDTTQTESVPWRRHFIVALANLYFCKYFYTFKKAYAPNRKNGYIRSDIHTFVGAPHNVEVAKMMFKYLDDTVVRLAKEGSLTVHVSERSSYRTTFMVHAAIVLRDRLNQRRLDAMAGGVVKTSSGTNLPALMSLYERNKQAVDKFVAREVGKLRAGKTKITMSHAKGALDGHAAGQSIGLDKQVGGRGNAHLLK